MADIDDFLDKTEYVFTVYDDKLMCQMIQNINVVNASKIKVVLRLEFISEDLLGK